MQPVYPPHGGAGLWRDADQEPVTKSKSLGTKRSGSLITQLSTVAVVITGGGSGLGAATARAMAAKGAKIGVLDQSKENAEKVAAEVKGVALPADVTDEDQVKGGLG